MITNEKICETNDTNVLGSFSNEHDFIEAVTDIESATERNVVELKEITSVGMSTSIFIEKYKEENKNRISEEKLYEILSGSGFGIVVKDKINNTEETFSLRPMAIKSMLDRAKISGSALSKLPAEKTAAIVNDCFNVFPNEKSCITIVGDKVSAMLSENYIPLNPVDLYRDAFERLEGIGAKFESGYITHSFFCTNFKFDNKKIIEAYKEAIDDTNWNVVPVVSVVTSNTGNSGANIYPMFKRGSIEFIIGKPLCIEHKGDASLGKFSENLNNVYAIFRAAIKNLETLKNTKIYFPKQCFANVAKKIGLPKKYAALALADFGAFLDDDTITNAHDIYMGLTESLSYAAAEKGNSSFIKSLQEILARALICNWKEADIPTCEWKID